MRDIFVDGGEGAPYEVLESGCCSGSIDKALSLLVLSLVRVVGVLLLAEDCPEVSDTEHSVCALHGGCCDYPDPQMTSTPRATRDCALLLLILRVTARTVYDSGLFNRASTTDPPCFPVAPTITTSLRDMAMLLVLDCSLVIWHDTPYWSGNKLLSHYYLSNQHAPHNVKLDLRIISHLVAEI